MENDKQATITPSSAGRYMRQQYPKRYQRLIVYYCLIALVYCLIRSYDIWPCCIERSSFGNIFISPLLNAVELFGGIYQWLWRHSADAPTAGWVFTFYFTMFFCASLLISTIVSKEDDNDLMAEIASGLVGILIAHMAINLSLAPAFGNDDSTIIVIIHKLLSNPLVLFTAAFFIMISLHRAPFWGGRLNGLMMLVGFGTGLTLVVTSGAFPFFFPTKSHLIYITLKNIAVILAGLACSFAIAKALNFQSILDRHEDNMRLHDVDLTVDTEAIKDRISH